MTEPEEKYEPIHMGWRGENGLYGWTFGDKNNLYYRPGRSSIMYKIPDNSTDEEIKHFISAVNKRRRNIFSTIMDWVRV